MGTPGPRLRGPIALGANAIVSPAPIAAILVAIAWASCGCRCVSRSPSSGFARWSSGRGGCRCTELGSGNRGADSRAPGKRPPDDAHRLGAASGTDAGGLVDVAQAFISSFSSHMSTEARVPGVSAGSIALNA